MCGIAVDAARRPRQEELGASLFSRSRLVSSKSNAYLGVYDYVGVDVEPGANLVQAAVSGGNGNGCEAVIGWSSENFGVQQGSKHILRRSETIGEKDYLSGEVNCSSTYTTRFASSLSAESPRGRLYSRKRQRRTEKTSIDRERPVKDLINLLPDECLYEIFGALPRAQDRCACAMVCRRWLFLQSHMPIAGVKPKPACSSTYLESGQPSNVIEVGREDCEREMCGEGRQGSKADTLVEAKEEEMSVDREPGWAVGDLKKILNGKKATDVRLASIAVGTAARGGLGELAIKGRTGLNVSTGVSDVGLSAIGMCCGALRSLFVWNCPNIGDEGLVAIGKGCRLLQKLHLLKCAGIGDAGIHAVAEGCRLTSVTLESCRRIGNSGLKSIGRLCPELSSLSVINCCIGREGVEAIVLSCRNLKKMKLEKVRIDDAGIALVGEHCKSLVKLKLSDLKIVSEVGFLSFGRKASNMDELRAMCVSACQGLSNEALEVVGKGCKKLKVFSLVNCDAVSDPGLKALTKSCLSLESLHLDGCNGITHVGLKAALENRGDLKTFRLSNCNGFKDEGLRSLDFRITFKYLKFLSITHCTGVGNECLEMVRHSCPALEEFELCGLAGVTDRGLKALTEGTGSKLQSLNLSGCVQVSDRGVCAVIKHCGGRLERLNLEGCVKVTDKSLKVIAAECPALEDLDVSKCDITDVGVLAVVDLNGPRLKNLSLAGCKLITDKCLPAIGNACEVLVALNLKQCHALTREALDCFETKFYKLDLWRS